MAKFSALSFAVGEKTDFYEETRERWEKSLSVSRKPPGAGCKLMDTFHPCKASLHHKKLIYERRYLD